MKVGDRAEISRAFRVDELAVYSRLCGHALPDRSIPEPLIGALFSFLLGVHLPGEGTMYLKQETRFEQAAAADETLTAQVEITALRPEKKLADLSTTCRGMDGRLIATGRALVYVGDVRPVLSADV